MFIGDMHIGRNPIRLPPNCTCPEDFGPVVAWQRSVNLAVEENVLAVVLAGDVVDCIDDRFEAQRAMEPGLSKLQAAGIPVIAVAGNHDVKSLPRLADMGLGLKVLGRGGNWECIPIDQDGETICHLTGWSFFQPQQMVSPLLSLTTPEVASDLPNLGVLHCDVDQNNGPYAPVKRHEFESGPAAQIDAWFLGHVHAPSHQELRGERPWGYLGSLVGLSPKETGTHGPWIVSLDGHKIRAEQKILGPIRFDSIYLDLTDLAEISDLDLEDFLQSEFRRALGLEAKNSWMQNGSISACGIRLHLIGQVSRPARIREIALRLHREGEFLSEISGCIFFAESVQFDITPAVDLHALSSGKGPLALLAKLLTSQKTGDHNVEIASLLNVIDKVAKEPNWQDLAHDADPLKDSSQILQENLRIVFNEMYQELMQQTDGAKS